MKKRINDGAHIYYSGRIPRGFVKKTPTNPGWGRYDWDDNEFEDMVKQLHPGIRLNSIKDYADYVNAHIVDDTSSTSTTGASSPSILTTSSLSSSSSSTSPISHQLWNFYLENFYTLYNCSFYLV
jgi:hypothetical protein